MPRTKKTKKIEAQVYDTKGSIVGKIILPEKIFAAKVNPTLLAQAVRVYLTNKRQGTKSTKTRSEVSGSTRKIYRQKGTGRARHGDIKAPIFRGGGIAHGPKPRNLRLVLPKKMRRQALCAALTEKLLGGNIKVVRNLEKTPAKTKDLVGILSKLNLMPSEKNKILIITPGKLSNVYLASRNIPSVSTKPLLNVNTYEVLLYNNLLFTEDAIKNLK